MGQVLEFRSREHDYNQYLLRGGVVEQNPLPTYDYVNAHYVHYYSKREALVVGTIARLNDNERTIVWAVWTQDRESPEMHAVETFPNPDAAIEDWLFWRKTLINRT